MTRTNTRARVAALRRLPDDRHVTAALALLSSIALVVWYLVRG